MTYTSSLELTVGWQESDYLAWAARTASQMTPEETIGSVAVEDLMAKTMSACISTPSRKSKKSSKSKCGRDKVFLEKTLELFRQAIKGEKIPTGDLDTLTGKLSSELRLGGGTQTFMYPSAVEGNYVIDISSEEPEDEMPLPR